MAEKITSIPAAKRTINALSDIGYDLNSAIADIVDNSISRGRAKNIHIVFKKDDFGKFYLFILDDGKGMTSKILEEAMRYGSGNDDYGPGDLSKYGMGMKTASNSQASKLTVLSKMDGSHKTGFLWDVHHVDKSNKWEMFKLNSLEINTEINTYYNKCSQQGKNILDGKSWTIVIWNDLFDFQSNYDSYKSSVTSDSFYYKVSNSITTYLRLVFSRFIDGENGAKKTNIYLNNIKLKALDPFCRSEEHTTELELSDKNGNYIIDDNYKPIIIKRYVLPTNPTKPGNFKFSSVDSWDEAKGTLSWNDAQGYYVYRNNRLISWGGWYRTKANDEHDKLARASIDLTEAHDELFTIDVKKTRIQFPEELRNHLKDNVNAKFIAEAKKRYAGSEKKKQDVQNVVREKSKKVSHLSAELVRADNISVTSNKNNTSLLIKNKYGTKVTEDTTYRDLEAGQKIISKSFGDQLFLWKMIPSPHNEFQVLVNTDHPFYDKVYGDSEKDKKITAIMDAFLFTMSFIELKCITNNNELLFDQMKEVASTVLAKFIDEKIL